LRKSTTLNSPEALRQFLWTHPSMAIPRMQLTELMDLESFPPLLRRYQQVNNGSRSIVSNPTHAAAARTISNPTHS
jgi:hypothetical protein